MNHGHPFRLMVFGLLLTVTAVQAAWAQEAEPLGVRGSATVTNKGISFIPAFTLGKPAAIFDLSVGRRLRFEPNFRFGFDGKPWVFLLWFRYDLVDNDRFALQAAMHPAFSFRTSPLVRDGTPQDVVELRQYLAGQLAATWKVSPDFSVGASYLYSGGRPAVGPHTMHFVAVNGSYSMAPGGREITLRITPQAYYLRLDDEGGVYASVSASLSRRELPLKLTGMINTAISTDLAADENTLWNVSLVYDIDPR